jgi:bacterioferritin (cytochrome b1)
MTDSLLDLLDKAIEKELSASTMYFWQYLTPESSEIKDDFKDNALEKLKQAMKIGEILLDLGEIPASAPENVGKSMKEMIGLDLKSENQIIKIYQQIIEEASKEGDSATRRLFEEILTKEKERKKVLMCARGRAAKKGV